MYGASHAGRAFRERIEALSSSPRAETSRPELSVPSEQNRMYEGSVGPISGIRGGTPGVGSGWAGIERVAAGPCSVQRSWCVAPSDGMSAKCPSRPTLWLFKTV